MNIESSSIRVASQQASSRYFAIEETLHAWAGTLRPNFEDRTHENRADSQLNAATISDAARRAAANAQTSAANGVLSAVVVGRNISPPYLGNIATQLAPKNSDNALQGQARTSGIYLSQDGAAGEPQQIDLVA
jgi:hypothetical protein